MNPEVRTSRSNKWMWGGGLALLFFCASVYFLPILLERSYSSEGDALANGATTTAATVPMEPAFVVTHIPTPAATKAIYMTACVAATPSWRESLKKFVSDTELNSIVIDIKDYSGTVSVIDPELQEAGAPGCKVKDMQEFVDELHKAGIYVIGRVTVFQDPYYTKLHPEVAVKSKSTGGVWKDHKGLAFVDVGATQYWAYVAKLAKASFDLGFDEINFDYIRYPSDGDMKDADYTFTVGTSTRAEMLEGFFSYLNINVREEGVKTSADLFGLTTLASDDMGIGQVLERALPYFDYIDPMVYPSHFAMNTGGFGDPSTHPYEIIAYSMGEGAKREQLWNASRGIATTTASKLRPWIQDFDLGANYGVPEVQAQMKATYDVGLTSWLSWDAGNKYTQEAYKTE